jgi:hypothetical protein
MEIKTVTEFSVLSDSEKDKLIRDSKLNKTDVYSKKILQINKIYKRVEQLLLDIKNIRKDKTVKGNTQASEEKHMTSIEGVFQKYNIPEKSPDDSEGIFYSKHPNGKQKFPDYRLFYKCNSRSIIRFINIELKSSNSKTILWNDGFPDKEDTIYIFTDTKEDRTFTFTSKSTPQEDMERYRKQCEQIVELNRIFKEDKKDSLFNFYTRKAISQKFVENKNDFIDCKNLLYKLLDEYTYSN